MRRAALLAAAASTFAEIGYDRTTIEEIIGRAGTSKGGFYHHFQSKDDLLEALAGEAAEQALQGLEGILSTPGLTAVERLGLFLRRGRQDTDSARDLATYGAIFKPENLALYHRLHRAVASVLVAPLARLIEQGRAEGTMRCEHAGVTAEIVLTLGPLTHDAIGAIIAARTRRHFDEALAAFRLRLVQQALAVDRFLGLPDGTVSYWDDDFAAKWTFRPRADDGPA
jgi:AcrR family transcriptional regulator